MIYLTFSPPTAKDAKRRTIVHTDHGCPIEDCVSSLFAHFLERSISERTLIIQKILQKPYLDIDDVLRTIIGILDKQLRWSDDVDNEAVTWILYREYIAYLVSIFGANKE